MKKGGLADSPFFRMPLPQADIPLMPENVTPKPLLSPPKQEYKKPQLKTSPLNKSDTVIPRHHETKHGITTPRYHDTTIETVRKAVKEFGKEAATHRFTIEEKKAIADIIYAYKGQAIKTSENEIARIAINFIITDYRENGENSVLHKALQALRM